MCKITYKYTVCGANFCVYALEILLRICYNSICVTIAEGCMSHRYAMKRKVAYGV